MSATDTAQWEPPTGDDFGEATHQARDARDDAEEEPAPDWWTDAYEIRMRFGIPEFDPEVFEWGVYPDVLTHEKPAKTTKSAGGTDFLRIGERGTGKSNDNLHWAARLMEVNQERVVWRGSPERSEWLPFREWTTLWLPANASIDAGWQTEGDERAPAADADLEDVVREVVRYEDPVDLLEQIENRPAGTFNVVYPDPSFTGCAELTRDTNRVTETLPFVPEWKALGNSGGTPLVHWWFALLLAAVEDRTHLTWLAVIFDEAGDLAPEDAEDDEHKTFKKLSLLRSVYADSRRRRLSIYWSAHYEENLHHKIRREVEWRVHMAGDTPNPRKKRSSSVPVGFGTVPMETDIMTSRPTGTAVIYNQSNFDLYKWNHIERPDLDDRWLAVSLGEPEDDADDETDAGPTVLYDDSVFKRWTRNGEDRLYVRDPGDGHVDMMSGAEAEPLESPRTGMRFGGIEDQGDYLAISLRPDDAPDGEGESVLVAKFPKRELGLGDDGEAGLSEANP